LDSTVEHSPRITLVIIDRTGNGLGFLYEDPIEEGLADLEAQYDYERDKTKGVSYQASTTLASPTARGTETAACRQAQAKGQDSAVALPPLHHRAQRGPDNRKPDEHHYSRTDLQGEAIHSGYVLHPLCEG
jgi:hypothetical protein